MEKATEMTSNELVAAARNYDKAINEGGEGYNPYSSEMERREYEQYTADAKAHATTPQGKIDTLYRRVERECGSVAREWGNNEEIDALQKSLYNEIDRIKAEIDAKFLKTWALDVTKTRREEWNNFVNTELKPLGRGHALNLKLWEKQKDQGWTMDNLKKAVALHSLNK